MESAMARRVVAEMGCGGPPQLQDGAADLAGGVVEEATGEGFEFLRKVGQVNLEFARFGRGIEQIETGEFVLEVLGTGGGGVDEADLGGRNFSSVGTNSG